MIGDGRGEVLARLRRDAEIIARAFDLRYHSIGAARADARSFYGLCDEQGRIRIRLNHVRTGRLLRYSSLVNTLCHELAHLRHFHHGPAFQAFYRQILEWARGRGLYRPRRPDAPEPEVACSPPLSGAPLREALDRIRRVVDGARDPAAPASAGEASRPAPPTARQLSLFEDGR